MTADEAADRLASRPYEDLGFAKVDHDRALRSSPTAPARRSPSSPPQCSAGLTACSQPA